MAKTKSMEIDGAPVPVEIRVHNRARQISLSVDVREKKVRLVLPRRTSQREGLAFAASHSRWLKSELAKVPERILFDEGAVLPYFGEDHLIRHRADKKRGVWREDGAIHVSGKAEHLSRRVRDWLRAEARHELTLRSYRMAAEISRYVQKVTVRDTRSRWGSCTSDGRLSFSWRLILAPPHVMDYVVAHEVAHLREMNHSKKFWTIVDGLVEDPEAAKAWVNHHGLDLHRFG